MNGLLKEGLVQWTDTSSGWQLVLDWQTRDGAKQLSLNTRALFSGFPVDAWGFGPAGTNYAQMRLTYGAGSTTSVCICDAKNGSLQLPPSDRVRVEWQPFGPQFTSPAYQPSIAAGLSEGLFPSARPPTYSVALVGPLAAYQLAIPQKTRAIDAQIAGDPKAAAVLLSMSISTMTYYAYSDGAANPGLPWQMLPRNDGAADEMQLVSLTCAAAARVNLVNYLAL